MKNSASIIQILKNYSRIKNPNLSGRYLSFESIEPEIKSLPEVFDIREEGRSTLGVPIPSITFGNGPIKILAWSQMHGNETTTTKALFDLFRYFSMEKDFEEVKDFSDAVCIKVIPMLNPDGAKSYTRENANHVDLNRDADALTQKESKILRAVLDEFKPDFCFNLHDQRTIFGAGKVKKPATLSFLAPSMDEERSINSSRKKAMQVIAVMAQELQGVLKEQIGRFDDSFNINCTGDRFMAFGIPTILFEAGHFPGDYLREETRKYLAAAILVAIQAIIEGEWSKTSVKDYEDIPENQKNFFDIILRKAAFEGEIVDIAIHYQEKLSGGQIIFEPRVQVMDRNLDFFGHREIDCYGKKVSFPNASRLLENDVVDHILLNGTVIPFKIE